MVFETATNKASIVKMKRYKDIFIAALENDI
jgi:hypothetical protein